MFRSRKYFGLLIGILFTVLVFPPASFSSPSEGFISAYLLLKEADDFLRVEEYEKALEKYRSAAAVFGELQTSHPDWSSAGVAFHLDKCGKSIEEVEKILAERKSWGKPLRVHFIDVGQGDSTLIQCPDGSTILIDGGPMNAYPHLINYLKGAGVEKIDLLIATHPDGDHIGGLLKVLKTFPVATVLDSGKEHTTLTYRRYLELIRSLPEISFKLGRAGDRYSFGEVELLIVHPGPRLAKNNNDCSVVAKLSYGNESFLFTGDAEKNAEAEMLGRVFRLKSSVLKVGHHGSRSSTSARFLNSVAPRAAVISAGENNRWGHPTEEVLSSLKQRRAEIYRTDLQGTILMSSNGKELRVEFPGKAVYPDYPVPEEYKGMVIADRESLIYYLPGSWYRQKIPPEDREYFKTGAAAEAAGYFKSWN